MAAVSLLITMRSGRLSLLKSPAANEIDERDPVEYIFEIVNVPFLDPISTPILLVPLLVITRSICLSWFTSTAPIEYGEALSKE